MRQSASPRLHIALIALVAALGGAGMQAGAQMLGSPYGDLKEVTLTGRLVSLGDVLQRKYGAHAVARAEPQWALALPEGQLYTFLETEGYQKLIDPKLMGKAVAITARLFPRSQLLEVLAVQPAPEEAVSRKFFCEICSIHATDWGPCVCCGKEFGVVKPEK